MIKRSFLIQSIYITTVCKTLIILRKEPLMGESWQHCLIPLFFWPCQWINITKVIIILQEIRLFCEFKMHLAFLSSCSSGKLLIKWLQVGQGESADKWKSNEWFVRFLLQQFIPLAHKLGWETVARQRVATALVNSITMSRNVIPIFIRWFYDFRH